MIPESGWGGASRLTAVMALAGLLFGCGGSVEERSEAGQSYAPVASAARIRLRDGVSPESFGRGAASQAEPAAGNGWSDEGLEERAGLTAAGGTTVHLQGRYRATVVRRRASDGTESDRCVANLPAAAGSD